MKFKEARYYKKLAGKKVHCVLCPHSCIIENGEVGKCEVRQNVDGNLKAMEYGKLCVVKEDKTENFMNHVLPGEKVLGIASIGNTISVKTSEKPNNEESIIQKKSPAQIIKMAEKQGNKAILYDYTEPIVFYEYIKDVSEKKGGLKHIIVTNGYINEEPIIEISKSINAASIKLKSADNEIYELLYNIKADKILNAIKRLKQEGLWIEINVKLIYNFNDSIYNLRKIASWVLDNLGPDTPINFIPSKKSDIESIKKARKSAMDSGLNYVYIESDWSEGKTTYCPNCKRAVIIRNEKIENHLNGGKCKCGQEIPGIWH